MGDLNTSELSVGRALISALPFFCALRNLSDCARLEMLQTEFRREMGCSESFVDVRDLPHPFGVGNRDDFEKKRSYWFAEVRQGVKSTDTLSVPSKC